jgi:hypothetical protein
MSANDTATTTQKLSPSVLAAIGILVPSALTAVGAFLRWCLFKRKKVQESPNLSGKQPTSAINLNSSSIQQQSASPTFNVNVVNQVAAIPESSNLNNVSHLTAESTNLLDQPPITTDSIEPQIREESGCSGHPEVEIPLARVVWISPEPTAPLLPKQGANGL